MKVRDIFKRKEISKKGPRIPLFAKIFYAAGAFSLLLNIAFLLNPGFSDFFNRRISSVLRAALAYLTGIIPFSLAEFFILMIPAILVALTVLAVKKYSDSWRSVGVYCAAMLSFVALVFSVFTFGFSPAYRGTKLEAKLGIDREKVSAEELYETSLVLAHMINKEIENVIFSQKSFSVMPYSFSEMNERLLEAYSKAYDKYPFLSPLNSRLKPIMLSEPMSYTHITGVYTFFTGETNINVNEPDYTIPFTAAHELAHQRGIAREDEANFVAFLVCLESDDPYIRYSGLVNMYEYVAHALYNADSSLYYKSRAELPMSVKYEFSAYSEFNKKYADSVASDVSGAINNTFLTIQGTEGTKSYGMVVDLAVAYYRAGKLGS